MNDQKKQKQELIRELQESRQECLRLKTLHEKHYSGFTQNENDWVRAQKLLFDVQKLAQIGIWEWDKLTDHVTWSEELYEIAGLDSNLPAPCYAEHPKYYTPPSWKILDSAVENALITGESYRIELEMIRIDGTIRNVIAYGGARFDAQHGKIAGLFGLVQDVTKLKQTEIALQESEFNFKTLINTMIIAIIAIIIR